MRFLYVNEEVIKSIKNKEYIGMETIYSSN